MSRVRCVALVVALLVPSLASAQRLGKNIEVWCVAGLVSGATPVTVASGSHAALHAGGRIDVGLQIKRLGLGIGGRYWQLAPTDEYGGQGMDAFFLGEWRLVSSPRTTLRGAWGIGFDDFDSGHGPRRPTVTTDGSTWSVGVGHEVVVHSLARLLLSADVIVPRPTDGPIGRRRPVFELGVGYRWSEYHSIGPL